MKKSTMRVVLLASLAIALTAALFVGSRFYSKDAVSNEPVEGKLGKQFIDFEAKFREIQARWNQNEKAIVAGDKASFPILSKLNEDLKALDVTAQGLKGESEIERKSLYHLVACTKALHSVPEALMLHQINPKAVTDAQMSGVKAKLDTANKEWLEWIEATKTLSR